MAYECDGCSSDRLLSINGKVSDMFSADFKNADYQGYVPHDLGVGGGDYIKMKICLNCGKVQGVSKAEDPEFYIDLTEDDEDYI